MSHRDRFASLASVQSTLVIDAQEPFFITAEGFTSAPRPDNSYGAFPDCQNNNPHPPHDYQAHDRQVLSLCPGVPYIVTKTGVQLRRVSVDPEATPMTLIRETIEGKDHISTLHVWYYTTPVNQITVGSGNAAFRDIESTPVANLGAAVRTEPLFGTDDADEGATPRQVKVYYGHWLLVDRIEI